MAQFEPDSWIPAIAVIAWLLMSITALAVASRLLTKYLLVGGLMADDALIMISFVFGIGNNIVIFVATAHGFVPPRRGTAVDTELAMLEAVHDSFYICNLTPASRDRILARVAKGLILVTAVTSLFGTAFQCRFPRTWDYLNEQCIDRAAWVVFLAAANGITDIVIFAQAMVLIVHVQATWKKKAVFASIFLPRLLVVASSIAEIILTKANTSSTDPFINASPTTICMEITQSLSIITASWGQLKPFMVRLRSNAFCLQNNEWTNPAYNGRPQP
ncbi:hypothetical protein BDV34DRAFT_229346 [Aspergillus parasiticus]|uniref:Rhodopsin domain-containing protein n=1 Tax=Aspergillus parasiticus TaxID=5067 RepID=A0A5N6D818_ASPPA|nr:hypothetical protein BDV34DRAFT_229346 [Aspergillus parasiticus]